MARGFFLAQLLRKKLTENQAMVVLEVARASVVEPGVLSLDAVCSVGALSRSVEDAELLLQSEPATGVGANEHTATVMGAVANISRNAGGLR